MRGMKETKPVSLRDVADQKGLSSGFVCSPFIGFNIATLEKGQGADKALRPRDHHCNRISSPAKSLLQCIFCYKHNENITSFFTEKSLPWTTHGEWHKRLSSSECVWASRALDLAGGD